MKKSGDPTYVYLFSKRKKTTKKATKKGRSAIPVALFGGTSWDDGGGGKGGGGGGEGGGGAGKLKSSGSGKSTPLTLQQP